MQDLVELLSSLEAGNPVGDAPATGHAKAEVKPCTFTLSKVDWFRALGASIPRKGV